MEHDTLWEDWHDGSRTLHTLYIFQLYRVITIQWSPDQINDIITNKMFSTYMAFLVNRYGNIFVYWYA